VSHLLWRWVTDPAIQGRYLEEAFYARFGTSRGDTDPLDNAMLKLFQVLSDRKPADVVALVGAYRAGFPSDAAAADRVVTESLAGQPLPSAPELWLTNRHFSVGISVLDQYRALPRPHRFDLNAASLVDLLAVPDVDRRLADSILSHGPYQRLNDLSRVPGLTSRTLNEFRAMEPAPPAPETTETDPDLGSMVGAYLGRALLFLLIVTVGAAMLQRLIRRISRRRALLLGTTVALLGTIPAWLRPAISIGSRGGDGSGRAATLATVCLLLPLAVALPATLLDLLRHRDLRHALRTATGWLVSMLPAVAVTRSWY
jgi:hypothetical protein